MSILAVAARVAATALASKALRAFGAKLAFAALRKLAAQTTNKLDDEAVSIVEQAFYGDDRKQRTAIRSLYTQVKAS